MSQQRGASQLTFWSFSKRDFSSFFPASLISAGGSVGTTFTRVWGKIERFGITKSHTVVIIKPNCHYRICSSPISVYQSLILLAGNGMHVGHDLARGIGLIAEIMGVAR